MMRYFNTIPFKFRANFAEILKKIGVNNFDKIGMFTNKFLGTKISNLGDKADKILEKMTYVKNDKQLFISYLSQWKDNDDIFYNQKIKDNVIKEHFYSLDENQLIIERMMSSDLKFYLSDDILCKVDRSAMYHGLETRVPFLSKKIYNFSQMLPYNQKIKGTKGKIILRKILSRHIPKNLIERPKMGFSIPLDQYLRTSLKKWSLDLVNRTELYDEYFDSKVVLDVWNKHQSGKYNYQTKLWPILTFISWRKYNL